MRWRGLSSGGIVGNIDIDISILMWCRYWYCLNRQLQGTNEDTFQDTSCSAKVSFIQECHYKWPLNSKVYYKNWEERQGRVSLKDLRFVFNTFIAMTKTSSQKLGRHALDRLHSVWKMFENTQDMSSPAEILPNIEIIYTSAACDACDKYHVWWQSLWYLQWQICKFVSWKWRMTMIAAFTMMNL